MKNAHWKQVVLCVLAVVSIGGSVFAQVVFGLPKPKIKKKPRPEIRYATWTTPAKYVGQLSEPLSLPGVGCTLRVPETPYYQRIGKIVDGRQEYIWQGPLRDNQSAAQMNLLSGKTPYGVRAARTMDQVMDAITIDLRQTFQSSWNQSSVEYGTINGTRFERVRWSGSAPDLGQDAQYRVYHGIVYVASDTHIFFSLLAQDSEPFHKSSLPLMEAAILTYHKH